jgi:hypothetical protein
MREGKSKNCETWAVLGMEETQIWVKEQNFGHVDFEMSVGQTHGDDNGQLNTQGKELRTDLQAAHRHWEMSRHSDI